MKKVKKQILSVALVFAMVLSMMPAMSMKAMAAEETVYEYDKTADTWEKAGDVSSTNTSNDTETIKIGTNGTGAKIKPVNGGVFKTGDVVTIKYTGAGSNDTTVIMGTAWKDGKLIEFDKVSKNVSATKTYTLTADCDELYFWRLDGSTVRINELKVTRETSGHIHTYSDSWTYDENNHWHAANCNDNDSCATAKNGTAAHTYEDGICTVCAYAATTYKVTVDASENGTVTASLTETVAGKTVTLTVKPSTGYELDKLTVTDAESNAVTVTASNSFIMPASNVTVSATFAKPNVSGIEYKISNAVKSENDTVYTWSFAESKWQSKDVYVQLPSATAKGTLKIVASSTPSKGKERYEYILPNGAEADQSRKIKMTTDGDSVDFIPSDIEVVNDIPYLHLKTGDDFKAKSIVITVERVILKEANVTLGGKIGLIYDVKLPASIKADEDAYVQYTVDGGTPEKVLVNTVTPDGDGVYHFTYMLAAKQMHDNVRFEICNANTIAQNIYSTSGKDAGTYFDYSVKKFMEQEKTQHSTEENLKALVDATLVFGSYAQKALGYNATATDGDDVQTGFSDITVSSLASKKMVIKTGDMPTGLTLREMTLILNDDTNLRLYFSSANMSAYSFALDGQAITDEVVANGYVEIPNIAAKDLDATHTLAINGSACELQFSALSYCYSVLKMEGTASDMGENYNNVARAIVAYNKAADTYFGAAK